MLLSKSPRHVADSILARESSDYYRIEGTAHVDIKDYLVALAYQRGGRKKITVNKVSILLHFERFSVASQQWSPSFGTAYW